MQDSILIQQPTGPAQQLVVLLHGVGSNAQDLVPVGQAFAERLPAAMVLSLNGFYPSEFGQGRQWFSVVGVTEENRPARVAAVMPALQAAIQALQQSAGVTAAQTTLIGFSQGSIMALESTQQAPALAGQVVAFSGRFATPPARAPLGTRIHLIHGDADPVIVPDHSRQAAQQLQALGAEVSLSMAPGMGHGINPQMLSAALAGLAA